MSTTIGQAEYAFLPRDKVVYGAGTLRALPAEVKRLGVRRAFIVTTRSLAAKSPVVDEARALLGDLCAGVFTETIQHVPLPTILAAASAARQAEADLIVSLGGGSAIDTARGVQVALAASAFTAKDFLKYRVGFTPPDQVTIPSIERPVLPHLSIPTTLSAAEFSHAFGATDPTRATKDLYIDPALTARVIILDPEVTRYTPDWLWACTGIRAVDHAVETIYSRARQPITDALGFEALRLLFRYLPRCHEAPQDLDARLRCQIAAWMSYFGINNVFLGLSHGIGHQLGARCNVPHGMTSCIMLPVVMEHVLSATQPMQAAMAAAMGVDTRGMSEAEAAAAAAPAVRALVARLGLPGRLRDVGVGENQFEALAEDALHDLVVAFSPVPVREKEEIVRLLRRAW